MPVNQSYMEKPKKAFRFIWRHLFTMADISLSINVLIYDHLLWKNAFISLSIAIAIDWAKQFIKLTPNPNRRHSINDQFEPLHVRQPWNSSIIGTPTHLMNIGHDRYN